MVTTRDSREEADVDVCGTLVIHTFPGRPSDNVLGSERKHTGGGERMIRA